MKSLFNKFVLVSIILILSLQLFPSCLSAFIENNISIESGAIPPDFGKDSEAVLLASKTGEKHYDKYLEENFKNFKGKYELINENEIHSPIYSNNKKYRFLFAATSPYSSSHSGAPSRKFYIIDRLTSEKYECPVTSGFFSKIMSAYVVKLNKELGKLPCFLF